MFPAMEFAEIAPVADDSYLIFFGGSFFMLTKAWRQNRTRPRQSLLWLRDRFFSASSAATLVSQRITSDLARAGKPASRSPRAPTSSYGYFLR